MSHRQPGSRRKLSNVNLPWLGDLPYGTLRQSMLDARFKLFCVTLQWVLVLSAATKAHDWMKLLGIAAS